MDRLLVAIQELSLASTLLEVQQVVRRAARDLADCDGATFVLRDGDQCFYVDEDAIEPLWKGQRFPMDACVSGWAMTHRQPVAIPDIRDDARVPQEAYRPTFVRSLVMTPIRTIAPVGAIGAYWAQPHVATPEETGLLRGLADATSLALEKVSIHAELERQVASSMAALEVAQTDDLTGLLNRRGFLQTARAVQAQSGSLEGAVAFVDVNGLKVTNDTLGHAAGDRVLVEVAAALRGAVRPGDVVGRLGGDEFAVLAQGVDAEQLLGRINAAVRGSGSVGTSTLSIGTTIEEALRAADLAMYAAKTGVGERNLCG